MQNIKADNNVMILNPPKVGSFVGAGSLSATGQLSSQSIQLHAAVAFYKQKTIQHYRNTFQLYLSNNFYIIRFTAWLNGNVQWFKIHQAILYN